MKTLYKHSKEIVISLVTGIFLFYFQPALSYVGDLFVRSYVAVSDKFSSDYYTAIAKDDPNTFADWSSFLLVIVISNLIVFAIVELAGKKKELRSSIESTLKIIAQKKEWMAGNANELENKQKEVLSDLENLEEQSNRIRASLLKRDNAFVVLSFVSVFLVVSLFANYAITKSINTANVEFRNDLTKVAPYISDVDVKTLKARWASMKTGFDYELIQKSIRELKNRNKLD